MADRYQGPRRARLATAGARAAVESVFGEQPRGDRISGMVFRALMLLALATALVMLTSLIIYSAWRGWGRLDLDMITEKPSRIRPEQAGYGPALVGSIYMIVGVIVLVVPVGVGAAVYLEEYAKKDRWYNRLIELNIQNLAGVPSIVFGILGLAFIARGPIGLGLVVATGSITLALLVLPTVIIA